MECLFSKRSVVDVRQRGGGGRTSARSAAVRASASVAASLACFSRSCDTCARPPRVLAPRLLSPSSLSSRSAARTVSGPPRRCLHPRPAPRRGAALRGWVTPWGPTKHNLVALGCLPRLRLRLRRTQAERSLELLPHARLVRVRRLQRLDLPQQRARRLWDKTHQARSGRLALKSRFFYSFFVSFSGDDEA